MSLEFLTFSTDWGVQFAAAATARGHHTKMVDAEAPGAPKDTGRILFARIPQRAPDEARAYALAHIRAGGKCIQSEVDLRMYENRTAQMQALAKWYPPGRIVVHNSSWRDAMLDLGLPLVSKARWGSSSSTVRALHTEEECKAEIYEVFGTGKVLKGGRVQYCESLWQQMLHGNQYALRIARVTRKYGWVFKVMNRPHDWRASGSGTCVPVTDAEMWDLRYAVNTFLDLADEGLRSRWCAADMLYDHKAKVWKAVDVTLAWNLSRKLVGGNYDAPIINLHSFAPHPKGYRGRDQWDCLLDDLEDHGA